MIFHLNKCIILALNKVWNYDDDDDDYGDDDDDKVKAAMRKSSYF